MTSADTGTGARRKGRTAAGWLPVNGTRLSLSSSGAEPDQAGQLGHRPVEVAVGVLDAAHEVAEQLEADRPVHRAPREQRPDADAVVERRVLPTEDGHGVGVDEAGVRLAGPLRQLA